MTALDTGGTSDAAEAEEYLSRAMRELMLEGWPQTADEDREVPLPTYRLTITGSTGTFTWGETVSIGSVDVVFSHIETVGATTYMYVSGSTTPSTGTATADYTDSSNSVRNFKPGNNNKAAGFPASSAVMAAGQTGSTSYVDIGAVQRQEPTPATPAWAMFG